jgi:heptosyltransferase I
MNAPSSTEPRILFIRLDRIGDLVLSLPVDASFQNSKWWIPRGLKFVTDAAQPRREALEVDRKISVRDFFTLLRETRAQRFERAVVFHGPWWVGLLLLMAGIQIRVGVRSQWHSFLFFNRGVRQKRSRAEYSELEYNFQLVEKGFASGPLARGHLRLGGHVVDPETFLAGFDLTARSYSVVHPGMGGSARNWPVERYEELVREMLLHEKVVITGTPADEPYVIPLREKLRNLEGSPQMVWLNGRLKGAELLTVLKNARTVTAPSTGVLHLAASTGVPTLGLFSPVRVQQPKRWGPQGERVSVLMPVVQCPGEMSCLGPACEKFDCMRLISEPQAFATLKSLAEAGDSAPKGNSP